LAIATAIRIIEYGKYEYLEKRYGISGRKWKNVCNRVQMPGIDMLSAILNEAPRYATWLMCGRLSANDDKIFTQASVQTDPFTELHIDPIDLTVEGWEEKLDKALLVSIQERTTSYKEAHPTTKS
jgi:hypothetical protein